MEFSELFRTIPAYSAPPVGGLSNDPKMPLWASIRFQVAVGERV